MLLFPELYEISKVYNAIPPTQVTVKRAFSSLSTVFTSRRCALLQKNLENILTIKLNKHIAFNIFKRELDDIEKD